jgi:hypothetical protein
VIGTLLVVGGCGVFVAIMAGLHVLRPDLPPLARGMSRYAGGGTLALATTAFLALALAWVGLVLQLPGALRLRAPLLVAASGLLVVIGTPIGIPSPSLPRLVVHTIGGVLFYLGTARAMLTTGGHGAVDRWLVGAFTGLLLLFALGAFGVPGVASVVGLLQRLMFAAAIGWAVNQALSAG